MIGTRVLPSGAVQHIKRMVDLRPAKPIRGDVSQNGEYSYLNWLIPSNWPKTLVEVGANDGKTFSNSYNLLRAGWKGVLVEPHPGTFAKLQANTAGTDVRLFNFAASAEAGEAALFEDTAAGDSNLMATLTTANNAWYDQTRSGTSLKVQLRRLDWMLEEAGTETDFTFMSTDTEGHDAAVLEGIGVFRPRVLMTERALTVTEDALRKQALLTDLGYVYADRVHCNEVYIHRDWLAALPHLHD
jgi:FkbM family methyltransferase